jgi:hypothetical protein
MSKYNAYLKTIESSLSQLINNKLTELNIADIQKYGDRPNAKFASGVVLIIDGKPTKGSSINAHVVATAKYLYVMGNRKAVKFNGDTNVLTLLDAYTYKPREAAATPTVTITKTPDEEIAELEAKLAEAKIKRDAANSGKAVLDLMAELAAAPAFVLVDVPAPVDDNVSE